MRCYIQPAEWDVDEPLLEGAAAHHVARVLRVRPGDQIELFNGRGGSADAEVVTTDKRTVALRILRRRQSDPLDPPLTLAQALVRPQKMDWVLQKAAELGAARVIPMQTHRCVVRSPDKPERWQRIVIHAAEQCGTDWLPEISPVMDFDDVLHACPPGALTLIAALTDDARPLREVWARPAEPTTILVGPEGDFTPEEMQAARHAGAIPVRMGPLTLRAETAGLTALAALTCAWR